MNDTASNPMGLINKLKAVMGNFSYTPAEVGVFQLDLNASKLSLGIEKFSNLQAIALVCKDEIAYLAGQFKRSCLASEVTKYRRVLINELGDSHPALEFFKVDKHTLAVTRNEYKSKVKSMVSRHFPRSLIDGYIAKAIELTKENSFVKNVAGLCALTGRRPIEIMLTASFSPSENGEDWAIFSGQAKVKRDSVFHAKSEGAMDNYDIPLLCDYSIVTQALTTLRGKKDFSKIQFNKDTGKTLEQAIHDQQSGELNKCVKRELGSFFGGEVTPYDLRSLYVAIQRHRHRHGIDGNEADSFISDILGHNETDLVTQRSYKKFVIAEAAPVTDAVTDAVTVTVTKRRVPPLPKLKIKKL